jgi:hypothetical protein
MSNTDEGGLVEASKAAALEETAVDVSPFARLVAEEALSGVAGVWGVVKDGDQAWAVLELHGLAKARKAALIRWSTTTGVVSTHPSIYPDDASKNNLGGLLALLAELTYRKTDLPSDVSQVFVVLPTAEKILNESSALPVIQAFGDFCDHAAPRGCCLVFLSNQEKYPANFLERFRVVRRPPLTRDAVLQKIRLLAEPEELPKDEEGLEAVYQACRGMSIDGFANAVGRSIRRHRKVCAQAISADRAEELAAQLGVEIQHPQHSFENLVGLDGLKRSVLSQLRGFAQAQTICSLADSGASTSKLEALCREYAEARPAWFGSRFDLEETKAVCRVASAKSPRGVLLSGVSGTGKTAAAHAIAHATGRIVLSIRCSQVLNKLVGETEKKFLQILRFAEDVDGVLFLDEVEKFFAGSENPVGSGVEVHAIQELLSWLNDHRSNAYTVMACNDATIFRDRAELARSGRLDLAFMIDIPTDEERKAIWDVHRRLKRIPASFRRPKDEDWVGSEIEDCCQKAVQKGTTLEEEAAQISPVAKRSTKIHEIRKIAEESGFLSAADGLPYRIDRFSVLNGAVSKRKVVRG